MRATPKDSSLGKATFWLRTLSDPTSTLLAPLLHRTSDSQPLSGHEKDAYKHATFVRFSNCSKHEGTHLSVGTFPTLFRSEYEILHAGGIHVCKISC